MVLRICQDEMQKDIVIEEGEMFLLPGETPHSPQRFPNTIGIVIEKIRKPEELGKNALLPQDHFLIFIKRHFKMVL